METTLLLERIKRGDEEAASRLFPLVYEELKAISSKQLAREGPGHTLQPTALVHEAYLRLVGSAPVDTESRTHFLAIAARVTRQVLIDHHRRCVAKKRPPKDQRVPLDDKGMISVHGQLDMVDLNEALTRLHEMDSRLSKIVELIFFSGMKIADVASNLNISEATVKRDWQFARRWLRREIGQG